MINNPGFTSKDIHFDIGVRQGNDPYFLLVNRGMQVIFRFYNYSKYRTYDCLLYPKVSIEEADAQIPPFTDI